MEDIFSIVVTIFIVWFVISRLRKSRMELSEVSKGTKAHTQNNTLVSNTQKSVPKPAKVPSTSASVVKAPVVKAPNYKVPNYYGHTRRDGSGHIHKFDQNASVSRLMDDRENDWLANQLREEHRAFRRTSAMFDLKIEHVSHCDATVLRTTHHNTCDANSVDTATV